jgi:hypothetical protein
MVAVKEEATLEVLVVVEEDSRRVWHRTVEARVGVPQWDIPMTDGEAGEDTIEMDGGAGMVMTTGDTGIIIILGGTPPPTLPGGSGSVFLTGMDTKHPMESIKRDHLLPKQHLENK